MKKIAILFFLFLEINSNAQVAGYLGKRFSVGYENYSFIAFAGPTIKNSTRTTQAVMGLLGINTTHCLNFDYVIKDRSGLCLSLQHFKTGLDYRTGHHYDTVSYIGDITVPARLSSNNIGLGWKFFRKGYIAPVGKYVKLELLLLLYKVKYNNEPYEVRRKEDIFKVVRGTGEFNSWDYSTSCTFGKQQIIYDKLILDYGFKIGWKPGVEFFNLQDDQERNTTEESIKYDAQYRIFRHQFFNFHIGIGFLAF